MPVCGANCMIRFAPTSCTPSLPPRWRSRFDTPKIRRVPRSGDWGHRYLRREAPRNQRHSSRVPRFLPAPTGGHTPQRQAVWPEDRRRTSRVHHRLRRPSRFRASRSHRSSYRPGRRCMSLAGTEQQRRQDTGSRSCRAEGRHLGCSALRTRARAQRHPHYRPRPPMVPLLHLLLHRSTQHCLRGPAPHHGSHWPRRWRFRHARSRPQMRHPRTSHPKCPPPRRTRMKPRLHHPMTRRPEAGLPHLSAAAPRRRSPACRTGRGRSSFRHPRTPARLGRQKLSCTTETPQGRRPKAP